jgi:glycosyltransferase involved in cell wall biosynthesis
MEVLCVNDGSTDSSESILHEYKKRDPRLKLINQAQQGTASARNNGLSQATGEYIYYLDSDDVMHPQLLEYALFLARKYEAELICFDWEEIEPDQTPSFIPLKAFECYPIIQPEKPLYHLKKRGAFQVGFSSWSKVFRRSLAEKVRFLNGNSVEDMPHTACVLLDNPKTVISRACLYYYTVRPDSVSGAPCSPLKIAHYHQGLLAIYQHFQGCAHAVPKEKELAWIRRHLFLNVLKQQVNQVSRLPKRSRGPVMESFRNELEDLKGKGLLTWKDCSLRYFIKYYLRYQWILAGHT